MHRPIAQHAADPHDSSGDNWHPIPNRLSVTQSALRQRFRPPYHREWGTVIRYHAPHVHARLLSPRNRTRISISLNQQRQLLLPGIARRAISLTGNHQSSPVIRKAHVIQLVEPMLHRHPKRERTSADVRQIIGDVRKGFTDTFSGRRLAFTAGDDRTDCLHVAIGDAAHERIHCITHRYIRRQISACVIRTRDASRTSRSYRHDHRHKPNRSPQCSTKHMSHGVTFNIELEISTFSESTLSTSAKVDNKYAKALLTSARPSKANAEGVAPNAPMTKRAQKTILIAFIRITHPISTDTIILPHQGSIHQQQQPISFTIHTPFTHYSLLSNHHVRKQISALI